MLSIYDGRKTNFKQSLYPMMLANCRQKYDSLLTCYSSRLVAEI